MSVTRWVTAVTVLVLTQSVATNVQQKKEPEVAIYGAGTSSCGTWLAAREGAKSNRLDVREDKFMDWLDGYATAYNIFGGRKSNGDKWDVLRTDHEGIREFLDKSCRDTPTNVFAQAVAELIDDQLRR
jgi:hypothetical protein